MRKGRIKLLNNEYNIPYHIKSKKRILAKQNYMINILSVVN